MVMDKETGKPKGYAFIEFNDSATAKSAIRNLNGYEMNARRVIHNNISTNFIVFSLHHFFQLTVKSSNTNVELKEYEKNLVQDVDKFSELSTEAVISTLKPSEAYDILEAFKTIIDEDGGIRARKIIETYPQLASAIVEIQVIHHFI